MTHESFRTKLARWGFNLFPAYAFTGARILHVAADWREVTIRLALTWRTRNYVGTIFGGSMYGAVDPIYMMMLIKILGPGYVVWDKTATIRFRKPGRTTLFASFAIDEAEIEAIRQLTGAAPSIEREYHVELKDAAGVVHASVDKTIYIRRADAPKP